MANTADAQKLEELKRRADEADRRVTALEQNGAASKACPAVHDDHSCSNECRPTRAGAPPGTLEALHAIKAHLTKAKEQQLKLEASETALKQQNQELRTRNAELEKQNDKQAYRIEHLKHWAQVKPEKLGH